jgi:hypothetical protein
MSETNKSMTEAERVAKAKGLEADAAFFEAEGSFSQAAECRRWAETERAGGK